MLVSFVKNDRKIVIIFEFANFYLYVSKHYFIFLCFSMTKLHFLSLFDVTS